MFSIKGNMKATSRGHRSVPETAGQNHMPYPEWSSDSEGPDCTVKDTEFHPVTLPGDSVVKQVLTQVYAWLLQLIEAVVYDG